MKQITNRNAKDLVKAYNHLRNVCDSKNTKTANALRIISLIIKKL
jgi:hypothetical protein